MYKVGSRRLSAKMAKLSVLRTYVGLAVLVGIFFFSRSITSPAVTTITYDADFHAAYEGQHLVGNNAQGLHLEGSPTVSGKYNLPVPYGIMYSPLDSDSQCKRYSQIVNDLHRIQASFKGESLVRLYSCDCDILHALDTVPQLQVVLGIHPYDFYEERKDRAAERQKGLEESVLTQLKEIGKWKSWERISMLVVGSQGVYAEQYSRQELVSIIKYVRKWIGDNAAESFKGLITTNEPVESWISSSRFNALEGPEEYWRRQQQNSQTDDLCAVVDTLGLVVHPYFNSAVEPHQAGAVIERDVLFAKYVCSSEFIGKGRRMQGQQTKEEENRTSNRNSNSQWEQEIGHLQELDTHHSHRHKHLDSIPLISDWNWKLNSQEQTQAKKTSSSTDGSGAKPVLPVVVLETGWPADGEDNGSAKAGPEHQRKAIASIIRSYDGQTKNRIPIVLYQFEHELWRQPGELGVEPYFGVVSQYED